MHGHFMRSFLTRLAGMFPNYALQGALSKTSGVKTIHIAPNETKNISIRGVCMVTLNEN